MSRLAPLLLALLTSLACDRLGGDPLSPRDDDADGSESDSDDDDGDGDDGTVVDDGLDPEDPLVDEPDEPVSSGAPYPIILVHGFSGWMDVDSVDYFFRVPEDLRAARADVSTPNLPPYDSSGERAIVLARVIDSVLARTGKAKVHLIGHSQGGIDCRTVITDLGYADRVASVHTISTPHRGSAVADIAAFGPLSLNPAGEVLGWWLGAFEGAPNDADDWHDDTYLAEGYHPDMDAAIENLRPSTMAAFNETHPDPPNVPVFSVAGVSNLLSIDQEECAGGLWDFDDRVDVIDPLFAGTGAYLSFTDGGWAFDPTPNDGLVTVASARWGTFLGCFAADHLDEIGQLVDLTAGIVSGFDHRRLYLQLLANARTVEALEP